jgi:hypothetical protein
MNIAVWYHTRLLGGEPEINPDFSMNLMLQQMKLLKASGLEDAATEIIICVNGDSENQAAARILSPSKARMIENGADAQSMLRTINQLRLWCQTHKDWLVCFWHIKGVTHPGDRLNELWRLCMEKHVIHEWRKCYENCANGYDTAGTHWLTKEQYGPQVTFPFWGGMFWWAKASFLAELPILPDAPLSRQDWFLSENWIGMGRYPVVKDYAPHWPGITPCEASLNDK